MVAGAMNVAGPLAAQSSAVVHFDAGKSSATVEGSVTGNDHNDYVLGAKAGQTLKVTLAIKGVGYFNILRPEGEAGAALFVGSMDEKGTEATVKLPEDGDFIVRIYLMGNDKDSGPTVPYTLSMSIE